MARVSTDDWIAVSDHMGRYCWLVDEGMGEEWAALWASDGVLTGLGPEPIVGIDQLRTIPGSAFAGHGGAMRHLISNLHCSYGEDENLIVARFYNHVTLWSGKPGAGNVILALCEVTLVRSGDGWLIKRSDARLLKP